MRINYGNSLNWARRGRTARTVVKSERLVQIASESQTVDNRRKNRVYDSTNAGLQPRHKFDLEPPSCSAHTACCSRRGLNVNYAFANSGLRQPLCKRRLQICETPDSRHPLKSRTKSMSAIACNMRRVNWLNAIGAANEAIETRRPSR